MKDVVERLKKRGLITVQDGPRRSPGSRRRAFKPDPLPVTSESLRAYHTTRKREALGYQPWKPGGPGRKPLGVCRWCGMARGFHEERCPRPEGHP